MEWNIYLSFYILIGQIIYNCIHKRSYSCILYLLFRGLIGSGSLFQESGYHQSNCSFKTNQTMKLVRYMKEELFNCRCKPAIKPFYRFLWFDAYKARNGTDFQFSKNLSVITIRRRMLCYMHENPVLIGDYSEFSLNKFMMVELAEEQLGRLILTFFGHISDIKGVRLFHFWGCLGTFLHKKNPTW